jgi:hypothetical protein
MQSDPTQGGAIVAARPVSLWERALLAQWFANTDRTGAHAVTAAYVSERTGDDPRLRNTIVIDEQTEGEASYLIHRPAGEAAWILTCVRSGNEIGQFRTLPQALHTIRPNRTEPDPMYFPGQSHFLDVFVPAAAEQ